MLIAICALFADTHTFSTHKIRLPNGPGYGPFNPHQPWPIPWPNCAIIYVYFPNPWNNIRPVGVYTYVRTDMRQERGKRSAAGGKRQEREREREREREGKRSEGIVERQRKTTVVTQKLGVTMAVRLLAPWSLPTRLPARVSQELTYLTLFTRVRFSPIDFHMEATITKPFTNDRSELNFTRDEHYANFDAYVIQQLLHRDPKAISSITWYTMTILATGKSNFSTS
ncbi:hypothetical protein ALC53_12378 [Atta colombica]|uniref:Uncharacterized protein n=1 Tax=Atta colombica TaxID=520822 RepID=A0A195AYP5_9HYME|nr:hypothetical protein ALC53_12378 [Atta colombica]